MCFWYSQLISRSNAVTCHYADIEGISPFDPGCMITLPNGDIGNVTSICMACNLILTLTLRNFLSLHSIQFIKFNTFQRSFFCILIVTAFSFFVFRKFQFFAMYLKLIGKWIPGKCANFHVKSWLFHLFLTLSLEETKIILRCQKYFRIAFPNAI